MEQKVELTEQYELNGRVARLTKELSAARSSHIDALRLTELRVEKADLQERNSKKVAEMDVDLFLKCRQRETRWWSQKVAELEERNSELVAELHSKEVAGELKEDQLEKLHQFNTETVLAVRCSGRFEKRE